MKFWKNVISSICAVTLVPVIAGSSTVVLAGDDGECEAIPFIVQGGNAGIGLGVATISVTATINTANEGPGPDYYLHQPAFMSWTGSDALDTTLTFSPGISELVARTSFHDDGWTGSGGRENYNFVARDSAGVVSEFDILDVDGRFEFSFSRPVTELKITYSPRSGVYGSFLRMSLPEQENACDPIEALPTWVTIRSPSGAMVFGDDPPALVPTALKSDDLSTSVGMGPHPPCLLYDFATFEDDEAGVLLTSMTPIGTYIVECTGMSVSSPYEIVEYELGEFRVVETEEDLVRPRPTFDLDYRLPEVEVESGLPSTH